MRIILLSLPALLLALHSPAQIRSNYYSSLLGINSEPLLFNNITMNSFEAISTSFQLSKENSLQKVIFSPFKLASTNDPFLSNVRLNMSQQAGITTFGVGIGHDSGLPFGKRGNRLFEEYKIKYEALGSKRPRGDKEPDYLYKLYEDHYYQRQDSLTTAYYETLMKGSFKLSLGYNVSLFEIIAGKEVDMNEDSVIDNAHNVESHAYSLGFTYAINVKHAVSVNSHFVTKRAGPEAGKQIVDYLGGSASYAGVVAILDKDYRTTKDYLKSLFIPSVLVGVSIEYLRAISNEAFAKDGIEKNLVITPFIDFRIAPKSQFRLGIPIKRTDKFERETTFGPVLQFLLQVSDTK